MPLIALRALWSGSSRLPGAQEGLGTRLPKYVPLDCMYCTVGGVSHERALSNTHLFHQAVVNVLDGFLSAEYLVKTSVSIRVLLLKL